MARVYNMVIGGGGNNEELMPGFNAAHGLYSTADANIRTFCSDNDLAIAQHGGRKLESITFHFFDANYNIIPENEYIIKYLTLDNQWHTIDIIDLYLMNGSLMVYPSNIVNGFLSLGEDSIGEEPYSVMLIIESNGTDFSEYALPWTLYIHAEEGVSKEILSDATIGNGSSLRIVYYRPDLGEWEVSTQIGTSTLLNKFGSILERQFKYELLI